MNMIKCQYRHSDCFANVCGIHCRILSEQVSEVDCPFYKTEEQVDNERMEAHERLMSLERYDLIEKYEYNSNRTW